MRLTSLLHYKTENIFSYLFNIKANEYSTSWNMINRCFLILEKLIYKAVESEVLS